MCGSPEARLSLEAGACVLVPRGQTRWRLGLAYVGAQKPDYRWRLGACVLVPRGQTCWRLGLACVGAQRPDYRWRLGLVRWCPEARHAGGWGLRMWVHRAEYGHSGEPAMVIVAVLFNSLLFVIWCFFVGIPLSDGASLARRAIPPQMRTSCCPFEANRNYPS